MRLSIGEILNRLERVKPSGTDRWTALCPVHDDKAPSLSVGLGKDGETILIKCWGCDATFHQLLSSIKARRFN